MAPGAPGSADFYSIIQKHTWKEYNTCYELLSINHHDMRVQAHAIFLRFFKVFPLFYFFSRFYINISIFIYIWLCKYICMSSLDI